MSEPVLLTVAEAAARRGITVSGIRQAIRKGTLPSTGAGQARRVNPEDVDAMPPPGRPPGPNAARRRAVPPGRPVSKNERRREESRTRRDPNLARAFTADEVRVMSWALHFAALSGRMRGQEPETVRGLMVRFYRAAPRERMPPEPAPLPAAPLHLGRPGFLRAA